MPPAYARHGAAYDVVSHAALLQAGEGVAAAMACVTHRGPWSMGLGESVTAATPSPSEGDAGVPGALSIPLPRVIVSGAVDAREEVSPRRVDVDTASAPSGGVVAATPHGGAVLGVPSPDVGPATKETVSRSLRRAVL